MCGIIGVIGNNSEKLVLQGLEVMKNRGKDNTSIWKSTSSNSQSDSNSSSDIISKHSDFTIGHNLHSIVNYVTQPLIKKISKKGSPEEDAFVFATNCEIYNWKELAKKYKIDAENDAVLLFELLLKKGIDCLEELDGVYAFVFYNKKENTLTLARDIVGVKPLFYSNEKDKNNQNQFSFASEKKSLQNKIIQELNPRSVLIYNLNSSSIEFKERPFFKLNALTLSKEKILEKLELLMEASIKKRIPDKKFGLLFSGGIDSAFIAFMLKKLGHEFTCYTAAIEDIGESEDLLYAKKIAKEWNLDLKIATIKLSELDSYIKKVAPLIESNNVVKVGVALPFFIACEMARKDKLKVIFSGLGSEELFAGYERHAVSAGINTKGYGYEEQKQSYENLSIDNVNKECLSGLTQIHERDLYRDDVVTMYNELELRLPFLDKSLIEFALNIPPKYKISKEEKKIILRDLAEKLGIEKEYARRPKKAAQYGSKFDKGIEKLAKKEGLTKSELLKKYYQEKNLKLGSLLSTGKDSIYSALVMQRQNYEISCFMTMQSENEHSFMFHTPNTNLAKLQADAAGIPLIIQSTPGNKEDELTDLVELLSKAKNKYHIDGVVTGAIFSTYQRDRIEKICDKLGLVCFSPLWHKDQEKYMFELLENNVEFIMSSVASDGLDKSWVGKIILSEDIKKLIKLNKKTGMNVAGEGGEFETFVLDCPLFKKKISIVNAKIIHDKERFDNVKYQIIDAKLIEK